MLRRRRCGQLYQEASDVAAAMPQLGSNFFVKQNAFRMSRGPSTPGSPLCAHGPSRQPGYHESNLLHPTSLSHTLIAGFVCNHVVYLKASHVSFGAELKELVITWTSHGICLAVTLSVVIAHERLAREQAVISSHICLRSLGVFDWLLASPLPMTATCPKLMNSL